MWPSLTVRSAVESWRENDPLDELLQAFGKAPQAPVEACRIIPKGCVPRIRHDVNLRVSHARLVLIDSGGFDNRIISAMRDQDRLADLR